MNNNANRDSHSLIFGRPVCKLLIIFFKEKNYINDGGIFFSVDHEVVYKAFCSCDF